jgi:hypothetical protein
MDTLQNIDAKTLPAGRSTDRLIAEFVYRQEVKTDPDGELRVAGECGHDPTPGEQDVRELHIVPQYSRDPMLAEGAFVVALQRAGLSKEAYLPSEPGSIYGDQQWTLREDPLPHKKIVSAPTKALMYCKAAILTLQRFDSTEAAAPIAPQAATPTV